MGEGEVEMEEKSGVGSKEIRVADLWMCRCKDGLTVETTAWETEN